jgi:hypothetical protein
LQTAAHEAYAEFGGVLTFPPDTPHGILHRIFNAHSNLATGRVIAPHELPSGNIPVEFINDRAFNAVAFIKQSKEYVGINAGVFSVYGLFSALLMSDPETFPTIGNPNLSAGDLGAASRFLADPESFSPSDDAVPVPQCPVRLGVMQHIMALQAEGGHVDPGPVLIGRTGRLPLSA